MFCKQCGTQLSEGTAFCANCGCPVHPAQQTQPVQPPVRQPYYPSQPYVNDGGSIGWWFLGFFFPLVGLILFLVWKDNKPLSAKRAGIGALAGFISSIVLGVLLGILIAILITTGLLIAFHYADPYYYDDNYDDFYYEYSYYSDSSNLDSSDDFLKNFEF